jgi:tRNA modification GTPase
MIFRDTIAAIATPPGVGGIGVIRISGSGAEGIARRLFHPSFPLPSFASHRLYHGRIVAPETGETLDEVLVSFFRAPRSYTGEDILEISCHGGPLVLRSVLLETLRAGARPAERGEFTKRAFLNGRLDLAQAEAVLDLITARTREGLSAAISRLEGRLSGRIEAIRSEIAGLLASVEAAIDFSGEEGGPETPEIALPAFQSVIDGIAALAATGRRGRIVREGIGIVIAGRPNVGKSSLLNRLLGENRAIVTPIPGTTRDFIEEALDIRGIPVRLTDTAGIRPPENAVEKEGIDRVRERLETADALLVLLDGNSPLAEGDGEILRQAAGKPFLAVINKIDLPQHLDEAELRGRLPGNAPRPVRISAKTGEGIERLEEALHGLVLGAPEAEAPEAMVADLRQQASLEKAAESLARARDGLAGGLPAELIALEIRDALDALGEITGKTTPEEILERIFANFCLGK